MKVQVRMSHYSQEYYDGVTLCAIHNKHIIKKSINVGCFYCMSVYAASDVEEYVDEEEDTALCPLCEIDAVIGDATGHPIKDEQFLKHMSWYGFSHVWYEGQVFITKPPPCPACQTSTFMPSVVAPHLIQ